MFRLRQGSEGERSSDPVLVFLRIVALHTAWLTALGFIVAAVCLTFDVPLFVDHLFGGTAAVAWVNTSGMIGNVAVGAFLLRYFVGRAKLCWDFCCTVFVVHLAVCMLYAGSLWVQGNWTWWTVYIASGACTTVFGEYLCMKKETAEVAVSFPLAEPLSLVAATTSTTTSVTTTTTATT